MGWDGMCVLSCHNVLMYQHHGMKAGEGRDGAVRCEACEAVRVDDMGWGLSEVGRSVGK